LEKPFPAYKGNEDYVFVCYSHADSGPVYADLEQLRSDGVNIWYDEGIPAGSSWRGEIAQAIEDASRLIYFISPNSIQSEHCLREVDYALNHDVPIIPVYLEELQLPRELALVLNRVQAVFRHSDERYSGRLLEAAQGGAQPHPFASARKRRKPGPPPVGWILAAVLFLVAVWQFAPSFETAKSSTVASTAKPNAFDAYLEGMELMERWDKGDNLETAIEAFVTATQHDPEFALAHARLAEARRMQFALTRDQEKLDLALASINEALRIDPQLAPVQVSFGRIQATQGNMDLAFDALNKALQIDPNDASANAAIARLYERLGRFDDAEQHFRTAVSLDPDDLLVIDSYANFLFRRGRIDEAIEQWQRVVRIAPDHYVALVNLGSALDDSGRVAEAITMYQRAIAIKPTFMAYSNLGSASSRAGRYQEAIEYLKKALEMDGSNWLAWGNLAYVYSWMDERDALAAETFARAIDLAEQARGQNPRDPWVHSDLALYYAKTGRAELALERLATATSLSSDSGAILAAAAEVHEILGQRDRALALIRESVELGYPVPHIRGNPELLDLVEAAGI